MHDLLPYQLLSDVVLMLHFAVVIFVVGGTAFILIGNLAGWRWVNDFGFRITHLSVIGFVVAETWLGASCPLTTLEMWLRTQARAVTYSRSFLAHWVQRLLYFDVPAWIFVLGYTVFGLLVMGLWWRFPPRLRHRHGKQSAAK